MRYAARMNRGWTEAQRKRGREAVLTLDLDDFARRVVDPAMQLLHNDIIVPWPARVCAWLASRLMDLAAWLTKLTGPRYHGT